MRLVVAVLSVVALAFVAPAAADPPTDITFTDVFPDVNPCTGNIMMVTIVAAASFHEHGSRVVARADRTITTSDGFVGRGTDTFVDNGQIEMFRVTDIMRNPTTGKRFRARIVFVLDLSTDTVRVDRFSLTCFGP